MVDADGIIVSLRLAWLKGIFNANEATWKRFLIYNPESYGRLFLLNCNYNIRDYPRAVVFYLLPIKTTAQHFHNFTMKF